MMVVIIIIIMMMMMIIIIIIITIIQVWVISVIFPYMGFFIGYVFAFICRRNDVHRRTIAIETGIQNMGVTFTVISMSYEEEFRAEANVIPILTAIFVTIGGISCVFAYRIYLFIQTKTGHKSDMELEKKPEKPVETISGVLKYPPSGNSDGVISNGHPNIAYDSTI